MEEHLFLFEVPPSNVLSGCAAYDKPITRGQPDASGWKTCDICDPASAVMHSSEDAHDRNASALHKLLLLHYDLWASWHLTQFGRPHFLTRAFTNLCSSEPILFRRHWQSFQIESLRFFKYAIPSCLLAPFLWIFNLIETPLLFQTFYFQPWSMVAFCIYGQIECLGQISWGS